MKKISFLWEIPLAFLSFLFYKITKFIIGNLFTIYLAINKDKASQWRVLSQETIDSPLTLPVLMTKGPRWNTHAIIGTLGPFFLEKSIAIDIESANKSARSWIAVIYSFPGYKTVTSLKSDEIDSADRWYSLELKPGKYSLGLRYYNRLDNINLPAVKVDERELVSPVTIPQNINDFYHNLIKAKNWFYSSLHYYIFTILKFRKWLPESFVRKEYLPVGAPDTFFAYNYLDREQTLQIEFSSEIINNFDIYFTLYDRSSLPLSWCQIKSEKYSLPAREERGYYLLRIRPTSPTFKAESLQSQIVSLDDNIQELQIIYN
ncbi:MAG: DUF6208 family protein [Xenococcaceae cyanobacterium MO_188.B32]|nr:DUF6208 family protein [Xenococcaceae cyanobacterium MO_188.B32]